MKCIGLSGRVGSGKSTAAQFFETLGVPVIYADKINQILLQPGQDAFNRIKNHMGEQVLLPNGELNKRLLRQSIIQDPDFKRWLETLLHPLIQQEIKHQIEHYQHHAYCVIEIPLLIKRQDYPYLDRMLIIDRAPDAQRHDLMKRDQINAENAQALMNIQASREAYLAIADDVIVNDGDLKALEEKVKEMHMRYQT